MLSFRTDFPGERFDANRATGRRRSCVILDLKGKVTLGEGDELLKDKVNSLVNQGHSRSC